MTRVTRGTAGGDAYLDLQNQARRSRRPTQELLQLYVLEGFLARLAESELRDQFVLKGGVLLAAYGERRPTKDVDLAGLDLTNNTAGMLDVVRRILAIAPATDDGINFHAASTTAETTREEDDYPGVRVQGIATLGSARISFNVDVNLGDPIWPAPLTVKVPRLRGGDPIEVRGYPIHMMLAEKTITAIQRGTANTRWRDFGDIWTLSRHHDIAADDMATALEEVARHRRSTITPLAEVLDGYAELAQDRWIAWRRRSNSTHLPEQLATVLDTVINFIDPILEGQHTGSTWNPTGHTWQ